MESKRSNDIGKREQQVQIVVFHLGNEEFGVPIDAIQEIIKIGNITPIPDMPDFIKGIINVRGDIVTTLDMKKRFLIKREANEFSRHIIITNQHGNLFGLIVDEVTEVLRINEKDIKPAPELIEKIEKDYVKGIIIYEGRLLVLLELSKVLSEQEFSKLSRDAKRITKDFDTESDTETELESNENTNAAEMKGKKNVKQGGIT